MPRIYTSASDPEDFCIDCFPNLAVEYANNFYFGG